MTTAILVLLRALANPWLADRAAFEPFLCSVLLVAWLGGFGPGLLATILGGLAGLYWSVQPVGSFIPDEPREWGPLLMYLGIGVAISWAFGAIGRSRRRSRTDAFALSRLNELSFRLWEMRDLPAGLDEMLEATIELLDADMGNVQILDEARGVLHNASHRGFGREFLDFFREVSASDDAACGRALRVRERVLIEDVESDPRFAPYRSIARSSGFRAVQSTPLIAPDGRPLGIISTHWRSPHRPDAKELGRLDLYARLSMSFIVCMRAEESRHEGEIQLADELRAMSRFQHLGAQLVNKGELKSLLQAILAAAADLTNTDKGNIQIYDASTKKLRIFVHQGLGRRLVEHFAEDGWVASCGDAATKIDRVLVQDVLALDGLRGTEELDIVVEDGIRSIQCTPLVSRDGSLLGMLNNHYRAPGRPGERALRYIDLLARQAADLIERHQTELALLEADRHKNEFLAMLAHELRNPLAPVRNAAQLLRLKDLQDPALVRAVQMIERQTSHMTRLIDDLLDVSRISAGVLQLRFDEIDLEDLVHAAVDACHSDIEARGHELRVTLPPERVFLKADRDRLTQVICNLISNAAKYTRSPLGVIEVFASVSGDILEIVVKDNGRGIPPDRLSDIFNLFVQVDRSLERQGGLGIGLTLARQLVELHGGTIRVESAGVDCGSSFFVRLPVVVPAGTTSPAKSSTTKKVIEARRVLVVDDNQDAADSLAMVLQIAGHTTRVAFDGESGWRVACEFRPEVVFLDLGMPTVDGYEVARRIRREPWGRSMRLLALTGWSQEEYQRSAIGAGFDRHLVKPVDPETALRLIADPVEERVATTG